MYTVLLACAQDLQAVPGTKSLSTSVRSEIDSGMPASCFHTGSAMLRLRGLPVLMAMPNIIPVTRRTKHQNKLKTMSETGMLFVPQNLPMADKAALSAI